MVRDSLPLNITYGGGGIQQMAAPALMISWEHPIGHCVIQDAG